MAKDAARKRLSEEMALRLAKKLAKLKPDDLSERQWTQRAGVSPSFFSNLRGTPSKPPSAPGVDTLKSVLEAVRANLSDFLRDESPQKAADVIELAPRRLKKLRELVATVPSAGASPGYLRLTPLGPRLPVVGAVAAGVWSDVVGWPEEDWQSFTGRADVTTPLEQRFGLRVEGDSMNLIYPHGTIVECVSFLGGAEIKTGRRVVVRRRRADLEYETTVKELEILPDGEMLLWPRSNHPDFQEPLRVSEMDGDIEPPQIIAVVVASVRPE